MEDLAFGGIPATADRAEHDDAGAVRTLGLHSAMFEPSSVREPPSILAPEFVMEHPTSSMTDHTYRGPGGWRDWINDLFEEFSGCPRLTIEAILTARETVVVASYRLAGSSVHTGEPIEFFWSAVTWFEERRATRSIACTSAEEALAILGRGGLGDAPERRRQAERITIDCGSPDDRTSPVRRRRRALPRRILAQLPVIAPPGPARRPAWL